MMNVNLNKRKKKVLEEICFLQKKLKKYPEGELLRCQNGKYVKWYISNHSSPIYIRKSQRALAVALAEKKYYELQLEKLILQRDSIEQYEMKSRKTEEMLEDMLKEDSPYLELLEEKILTMPQEAADWMQEEYLRNVSYPENLVHKTYGGQMVRSKSEAMIANVLFQKKIPYRYENILVLGESSFAPDFTIMHPKTGKVYYWEHFGLMDNPAYVEKSFEKLKVYGKNGIVPTINLILRIDIYFILCYSSY